MNKNLATKLVVLLAAVISLAAEWLLPDLPIDPSYIEGVANGLSVALLAWLAKAPGKPEAKEPITLPVIFPVLMLAFLVGCPLPPRQTWPQYLECAPGVHDIIGVVSRILMDGAADERELKERGKDELQSLARTHGADTVACVIDKLVKQWRSPGSTLTPETIAASVRGENFLRDVGVER